MGRGRALPGLRAQEVQRTKPLPEASLRTLPFPSPALVYSLNPPHWVIQDWSPQKKEVAVWGMADDQQLRQLR